MLPLSICSPDILWSVNNVFAKILTILRTIWVSNTIEHISVMELYNILSTLKKFECWNLTVLVTKY